MQWPGVQKGHWSATALLYASILLSLVAVVSGSQQLLVLPNDGRQYTRDSTGNSQPLPQQVLSEPSDRSERELEDPEKLHLLAIAKRFRDIRRGDRPNALQVFALQVPIMLLALAVVTFIAGLCSVVFAPLARQAVWDDNAKVCMESS